MKRNLLFCAEQMKVNIVDIIFKTIQISVAFLVCAYLIQTGIDYQRIEKQIDTVLQGEEMYMFRDMRSNAHIGESNDEKYTKPLQSMISEILKYPELVVINTNHYVVMQGKKIECMGVNYNFFKRYQLQPENELTSWEDFEISHDSYEVWYEKVKPAIVGADYAKEYQLNDVITDDVGNQYKIVGFLKKDAILTLPMQSADLIELHNAIFIPVNVDMEENWDMEEFILSCQFPAKERTEIKKIEKINHEKNVIEVYVKDYREQMERVKGTVTEKIVLYGTFGGIICFFSVVSTFCMIIQLISDYSYEYAVNILCGATLADILKRIILQFLLMLGIGVILTCLVFGFKEGTLCVLALSVLYILVVCLYTKYRMNYYFIVNNLRGN